MTRGQTKLIATWVLGVSMLGGMLVFSNAILENWDQLKWVGLVVLFVVASFVPRDFHAQGSRNLIHIMDSHPWVKAWFVLYAFGVLALLLYVLNSDFRLDQYGVSALFALIFGMLAPAILIQQAQFFHDLGAPPNEPLERSRGAADKRGTGN